MRILSFFLCLISIPCYAQINTFTAEATPTSADLLYLMKSTAGAGSDRKVTVGNLTKGLVAASGSVQGVVTTGPQTFAGAKTFSSDLLLSSATNSYFIAGFPVLRVSVDSNGQDVYIGLSGPLTNPAASGENVSIGFSALRALTTGVSNIAIGGGALNSNTSGECNIAIGRHTLLGNLTGGRNTAVGEYALSGDGTFSYHSGSNNVAIGETALAANHADNNTAVGSQSMLLNLTGSGNTAIGKTSLGANTTGNNNFSGGYGAMGANTIGSFNVGFGYGALNSSTIGDSNTAVGALTGFNAGVPLVTVSNSTFIGYGANSSVNGITNSTAIGNGAQVTASNQVVIGNDSVTQMILKGTSFSLFNVTPATRQTELTDELTTITHVAPVTPDYALQDLTAGGFGFVTKDEGNTLLSVIANLQARVNELETKLAAYGLLQDAD